MTPNLTFIQCCPCCGKELHISIQESGGESTATLSYQEKTASKEELAEHGYEFGTVRHKLIFNSGTARRLIQLGNQVVDIKPLKEDQSRSAFAFLVTEKFSRDLAGLSK